MSETSKTSEQIYARCERLVELLDSWASLIITSDSISSKIFLSRAIHFIVQAISTYKRRLHELGIEIDIQLIRDSMRARLVAQGQEARSIPVLLRRFDEAAELVNAPLERSSDTIFQIMDEPTTIANDAVKKLLSAIDHKTFAESLQSTDECGAFSSADWIWIQIPAVPGRPDDVQFGSVRTQTIFDTDHHEMAAGFHRMLMGVEIPTIEACALNIVLEDEMPFRFVEDMARQSWDESRHAAGFLQLLRRLNFDVKDFPASNDLWEMTSTKALPLRLAIHQRAGETMGINAADWWSKHYRQSGDDMMADFQEFVFEDEIQHVEFGNKWLRYICDARKIEISSVINQALKIRTAKSGVTVSGRIRYPQNDNAMKRAGYTDVEISELKHPR